MVIDGIKVRDKILDAIRLKVDKLPNKLCFVIIQVGDKEEDNLYIKQKQKMAQYVGYECKVIRFNTDEKEDIIIKKIQELNNDNHIHGIIVELPLPNKMDTSKIVNTIDINKDIDGITKGSMFLPATALGIMELFNEYNIDVRKKQVVVIGKSNLVGIPVSKMLLDKGSLVTICDSKTNNLKEITLKADILISATGKSNLITSDMVKNGVIVIDVGISYLNGKLCGDILYDQVIKKASYITPVPGGVGPMTIAMLAKNILDSYKIQGGKND